MNISDLNGIKFEFFLLKNDPVGSKRSGIDFRRRALRGNGRGTRISNWTARSPFRRRYRRLNYDQTFEYNFSGEIISFGLQLRLIKRQNFSRNFRDFAMNLDTIR